jgi:predicted ATPase
MRSGCDNGVTNGKARTRKGLDSLIEHETLMRSNLPEETTRFIGRQEELRELEDLLADSRLVTLTGPGGTGKTRLALQLGRHLQAQYPDGVHLVEYGTVTHQGAVCEAVMEALAVQPAPDMSSQARLTQSLHDRTLLLILDNCEHLVAEVAQMAAGLLRFAPGVRILATSREPLMLAGEAVWPVQPLAVPAGERATPDGLQAFESVSLFLDRARSADPSFHLDDSNAAAVAEICRRLDGIPMAIELAAARVRTLTPAQIAERLGDRFRLLAGQVRGLMPRQQTLRALVDWSYDLLAEPERAIWRRLSVFAGSVPISGAEAVVSGDGVEAFEVLDLVSQLVDKSVLLRTTADGEARYQMLETLRAYGQDRLREAGEEEATLRRFLAWEVALVADTLRREKEGPGPHSGAADQLAIGWPNVEQGARAAIRFHDAHAAAHVALAVAGLGLSGFRLDETEELLQQLVPLARGLDTEAAAASLVMFGTVMGLRQLDGEDWREALSEGIALARRVDSTYVLSAGLNNLGVRLRSVGDLDAADDCFREAYALSHHPDTLLNLATVLLARGDDEGWHRLIRETEEEGARVQDPRTLAYAFMHRAEYAIRHRDLEDALRQLEASLATLPPTDGIGVAEVSGVHALVLALSGHPEEALAEVARFPGLFATRTPILTALLSSGALGRHRETAVLAGLLERLTELDYMLLAPEVEAASGAARAALGDELFLRLTAEGRELRGADRAEPVRRTVAGDGEVRAVPSMAVVDPRERPPGPAGSRRPRPEPDVDEALATVGALSRLSLEELSVVGAYRRFDEPVRNRLRDWHRRIAGPIMTPTSVHENFLIWAAPGSGKSFLIQETARVLNGRVAYFELNLARLPREEFVSRLHEVREHADPLICLLDEVDARGDETWPYEEAFSLLDLNLAPDRVAVFVLVGSHPGGMDAMAGAIKGRSKGTDMLDRVPASHRFDIPAPTLGDRIAIVTGQVLEAARLRGEPVEEVEKFALYYVLRDGGLETPRQLRDLAVAAVQHLPAGETRLKYDDLFYRGDTRGKDFWSGHAAAARALSDRFVRIGACSAG